jgi:hypothetical protein
VKNVFQDDQSSSVTVMEQYCNHHTTIYGDLFYVNNNIQWYIVFW